MTASTASAPTKAIPYLVGATVLFVALDTTAKLLTARLPVPEIVWGRYVFHLLGMLIAIWPRMGAALFRTDRMLFQFGRGSLLLITTVLAMTALRYLSLADLTAIGFVAPFFVVALSALILRERVGPRRWAAIAIGFFGVLLIVRPGAGVVHWAAALPIVMALIYALYQVATRILAGKEHPLTTLFYTALAGTFWSSLALPFFWVTPADWTTLAMMVATGMFGGGGHMLMIFAYEKAAPSALQPFLYGQLVFAAVASYVVFGNLPDPIAVVGMVVIVGAGIYIWHREAQLRRIPKT